MSTATMLIHCPDEKGIILSVTNFISRNRGNIVDLDQHVDSERKTFFMRVEWTLNDFSIQREKISAHFDSSVAVKYQMQHTIYFRDEKIRMALMVSKMDHCFNDILSRYRSGEWNVEIPLIISNHPDMEETANRFGIPYHYIPVSKQTKVEQEKKQLQLLSDNKIEFVVLARYMQILSENFIKDYPNRIINIHHSFLPAFPGAKPCWQPPLRKRFRFGRSCSMSPRILPSATPWRPYSTVQPGLIILWRMRAFMRVRASKTHLLGSSGT